MTFKYYAVMQGEVVDKSNSLTSLKNRMDEYVHSMPSNMDYVYIVTGKKNPLIVKQYDMFNDKWYSSSNRYNDIFIIVAPLYSYAYKIIGICIFYCI